MPHARRSARTKRTAHLVLARAADVGEEIIADKNQHFRVVNVVPFEEDKSPFVGLLQVEAA